jgi:ABC-type sugar transport system ATPase subunit
MESFLKVENITKTFAGVTALGGVSLDVACGEVLALLGENGAGKSTLIKILSGVYLPDSGSIYIEGKKRVFNRPMDARHAGISVVHQELSFVPLLSVAENLTINHYGEKKFFINWKNMYRQAEQALTEIGLTLDLKKPIKAYSVAQRQQVEIARAIMENSKIVILDEPTSSLNDQEIEHLMECIRKLKSRGVGVILITHKLEEIEQIADTVVVLRDGQAVAAMAKKDTNRDELITFMVGRKITELYSEKTNTPGKTLMDIKDLSTSFLKKVSFSVREGEILGIYGLMGSGHLELGEALFGCDKTTKAEVIFDNQPMVLKNPEELMRHGIAFLPSDRKTEGLVLMHGVRSNVMMPYYQTGKNRNWIMPKLERQISAKWVKGLSIKTPSVESRTETLSGGNQQKVVLAKWLEVNPRLIILNEPTRGIDVGSKSEIYKLLNTLTCQGVAIIMITSEMPELMAMSDRVLIMYEGNQEALLEKPDITQNKIISAAIRGAV